MYRTPTGRLSFGDILEADWLFDIYLRTDSRALYPTTLRQGKPGFGVRDEPTISNEDIVVAQATMEPDDVVLTHGLKRMAIVLTDDCELASLAGERGAGGGSWGPRNRVLLASLRAETPERIATLMEKTEELSLHPLLATTDFPGGVVDFNRAFSVGATSLFKGGDKAYGIVASLDRDGQLALADRWAGHALRRGPTPAKVGARKLAQLWTADGDVDRLRRLAKERSWGDRDKGIAAAALEAILQEAWTLGGPILDDIDAAAERGQRPDDSLRLVVDSLSDLRRLVGNAAELFAAAGCPIEVPADEPAAAPQEG